MEPTLFMVLVDDYQIKTVTCERCGKEITLDVLASTEFAWYAANVGPAMLEHHRREHDKG